MKASVVITLLGALAALSPAVRAADVSASSSDRWMQQYYQNPRPDNFLTSIHTMSRQGELARPENVATSIGFLATVFAQNPQHVNYWLSQTATLPEADRRVIAAAAWQAGNPRGARLLREMSESASTETRQEIAQLLDRGAKPIQETPVLSESSMNLHWGAFLADGDDRHVLAVLSAFGSGERNLSSSARYSLAQNAAQHQRVMDICRAQLDKQPEPLREELRAALNSAGTRSNGS
jgi:hypothetical protein